MDTRWIGFRVTRTTPWRRRTLRPDRSAIAGGEALVSVPRGWVIKEAAMAATAVAVELVRYDDPLEVTERAAVAGFLAGY